MGRGDSSWQDRKHHIGKSRGGKKIVGDIETTPTVDTSVGTEGYDDTNTTAAGPLATLRLVRVS